MRTRTILVQIWAQARPPLLLTSMGVHVQFEVYFLLERLATGCANEGSECCVSAHVRVQVGGTIERFATLSTHVRLNLNGQFGNKVRYKGNHTTLPWSY